MTKSKEKNFVMAFAIVANLAIASGGSSRNRLSQIVLPFDNKRDFTQSFNPTSNTLTLGIANTRPHELNALDYYDDKLVRRVLVRDQGVAGTEVNLTFKDKSVTATVTSFEDPFRIVLDIFDRHYQLKNDPITGLPLADESFEEADAGDELLLAMPASNVDSHPQNQEPIQSPKRPRRLMQPTPMLVHSPDELRSTLSQLSPGIGAFWEQYPVYIYRIQTAQYHENHERDAWYKQHADKAMSSAEAMADYAGKLFDFGHENRALAAYQQVLYKDPTIFDKQPLHLWKFAETHFGQGNLTLADGYYQALIQKHPNHDLSYFSRLRRLDIEAIKATQEDKPAELQKLSVSIDALHLPQHAEIQAQAIIRKAFWSSLATSGQSRLNDRSYMPDLDGPIQNELRNVLPRVESQKTSFIASSLLLNSMVSSNDPWNENIGRLAAEYLTRFTGKAAEPYRSGLSQKVLSKVKSTIAESSRQQRDLEVLKIFEALPPSLKEVKDDPSTAWYIGEAYRRHLNQFEASIPFYQQAASSSPKGPQLFKANFWLAVMAGKSRQTLRQSMRDPGRASYFGQVSRSADQGMDAAWKQLNQQEKDQLLIAMKNDLAEAVVSDALLATPPSVLLEAFSNSLSSRLNAADSESTSVRTAYSPSASTVQLLSNIAKRFNELQQTEKRRQTLKLLQYIKPNELAGDSSAKDLWANELVSLAEDYRSDNLYSEAGQTFAFAGSNSEDFERRAESLYKGGLLLYRSGRREEAIKAFKQCSEDGNDRYYANLCSERLDRLNNQ